MLKTNQNQGRGNVGDALHRANQENRNQGQQQQPPQQGQQQERQQDRRVLGGNDGFLSGMILPVAANPAAETLGRLRQSLDDIYSSQKDPNYEVTTIAIDNETPGVSLAFSVLVVCAQYKSNKQAGVGYHALILEATGDSIPPLQIQVPRGESMNMTRTVGDAYDSIMQNLVATTVQRTFPNAPLWSADANVIFKDFKLDDKPLLNQLAGNSVIAATVELNKNQTTYDPFTLSAAIGDTSLSINTSMHNPATANSLGRPVRSDIKMLFRTGPVQRQQGQNQSLNLEKPQDIAVLTGFIDLVHQPRAQVNQYVLAAQQQYMQQAQDPNQFKQFYARFVITRMKVGRIMTLPMQILGLITASTMQEPGAWYPFFEQQDYRTRPKSDNVVDLKDVGVIGIELNVDNGQMGDRINTKSETFTPANMNGLLAAATFPGIILSLDVSDAGEETWFNGAFARAAMGDPEAHKEILDATNVLTDGVFGRIYSGNGQVVLMDDNRVQEGFYRDQEGVLRDVKDFDYVAAANLYDATHQRDGSRDWTATFLQTKYPIEQRLAAREKIMRNFFTQVEISGYATRVTFTVDYLSALMQAAEACKLRIMEASPFSDAAAFDLPTYQYAAQSVNAPMQSSVFTRGYQGQRGTVTNNRTGRWA